MGSADNHFLAFRIDGTEFSDRAASLYVAYNGWAGDLNATFPPTCRESGGTGAATRPIGWSRMETSGRTRPRSS